MVFGPRLAAMSRRVEVPQRVIAHSSARPGDLDRASQQYLKEFRGGIFPAGCHGIRTKDVALVG